MSHPKALAVFHLAETNGPFKDLELGLDWLSAARSLEVVVPGPGAVAQAFRPAVPVAELPYAAMTVPEGPSVAAAAARRLRRETRAFRAHIRATQPDVLVVATTTLPSAVLAARLEGVPAIVYAAEILAGGATGPRRSAAGMLALALVRRLAAAIVATSAAVARQFGDRGAPVTVAYPPIEDIYSSGDGPAFRAAHGIGPDDPCVVTVGNITRGRGQDVIVRALPLIRERLPAARCAIVGSPFPRRKDLRFREELPALARELGVAGEVHLAGNTERVADVYAAADVVVNPARVPESFGRAACEALLAERPVVSAEVGAIPEVLRDGETALLVPPDDPAALAEAVVRLLGDRDLAGRIASAGRRDVLERFSPDRARSAFRQVIEGVTGGTWPGR
jgi:glycosyltransferase involved in cell wall biosynthesis